MNRKIIIGTRGSDLALWQANFTLDLFKEKGIEAEIKVIQTQGDKSQQWNTSFDKLEGKGFFTKELEEALLNKEIDVAVHSHKDLPTEMPYGLLVAGVSKREDPSDVLLIHERAIDKKQKWNLQKNSKVGTSSARRKSQMLAFRPDVKVNDLRGNVPTRIEKLRKGEYDAILIAAAGLERLKPDLDDFHVETLDPTEFVPAPAQGVLAWQTREDDDDILSLIDQISDFDVMVKINIERRILNLFDGGCQLPLGAYCDTEETDDGRLRFKVWTSMAQAWDKQPKQLYFNTTNTDGFADEIVEKIQNLKPRKVFISRNSNESEYLHRALTNLGFTVEGKSLIEFKEIKIKELPKTDWVFFSSKHAVRYFLNQKPKLENVKFGCVGTSTSAELRQFGLRADFIGQSTDVKLVGKQFAAKVGSGKVLFPIAKDSLQSIQWQMAKKDNVINLNVYATLKHSLEINPENEILVFTSPSNVEAFLEKNKIQAHQKVVAMGDATENALRKKKIKTHLKPTSFNDLGLFQAILSLS
ncbi:MAG: hydroxymethylbilane synthase [Sphingobacteriaceae bacterium]|nr:hydroxymethylbilane synthase [Sphingobacteriaceae bacterium]